MSAHRAEFKKTFRLALPVVITQTSAMMMGLVDTFMMGKVSTAALAGVGAGNNAFWPILIAASGILYSLDPMISQAIGKSNLKSTLHTLIQGLWTSALLSPITMILYLCAWHLYGKMGATTSIINAGEPFVKIILWTIPLSLPFVALQRFWQAKQVVLPICYLLILANILNFIGDYALALGKWGFPQLGAQGVAISTLTVRFFLLLTLGIYTWIKLRDDFSKISGRKYRIDLSIQKSIFKVGSLISGQIALEVGVFALGAFFCSRLGEVQFATHHIALSIASITFMVPMGISTAAAVRVGTLFGAKKYNEARIAGWMALSLSVAFMVVSTGVLATIPGQLIGLFSDDTAVIELGKKVLILAAVFQIFDGIQVTTMGALRGLGVTRGPFWANLIGHYPIGLLSGTLLCFTYKMGVIGIWVGFVTGLFMVAVICTALWWWYSQRQSEIQSLG